ncbi:LysR family transcriptional regulator [Ferrimonas pelagia]|uniref:LysR family transcriptional regulator n=1 Tax=Ferrimonas pelagia TaxID=1177826 RepID=A0ABP9F736_9GAMM
MITLEQIHSFRQVYQMRSYSAAGRALGKERSTVREHIGALEDIVGRPLFTVVGKRVEPTSIADLLYPRALHLSKQARDFQRMAESLWDTQLTELTLLHDPAIPAEILVAIERQLIERCPTLTLCWRAETREVAYQHLVAGSAHIALMAAENKNMTVTEILAINLGALAFGAYICPEHPLAATSEITVNELRSLTQYLIWSGRGGGLGAFQLSDQCHFVGDCTTQMAMIHAGGWGILPRNTAHNWVAQGRLKELKPAELLQSYQERICLYYSLTGERYPEVATAIDVIKSVALEQLS